MQAIMYVCVYIYINLYLYIYTHTCVYICMCVYVSESLCGTQEINTTLSMNYTSITFKKRKKWRPDVGENFFGGVFPICYCKGNLQSSY